MTAQTPEILLVEDRPYALTSLPLDPYLKRHGDAFLHSEGAHWSTSNYRGYIGCWELANDELYLIGLFDPLGETFDLSAQGLQLPTKASWFSGRLDVDHGELLRYAHAGWGRIRSRRVRMYFEHGRFRRRVRVDMGKRLKRDCALTPEDEHAYRQWLAGHGHLVMGGMTRAGFDAIGREPFEHEPIWLMDAGDDDDAQWMQPLIDRCTRPHAS